MSSTMRIERPHQLGRAAAIQKIDSFADDLLRRPLPAGVAVSNPQKSWNGSTMTFSVKASRGFIAATINGTVEVTDSTVALDVNLPPMIRALVGEEQIRQQASRQLDSVLRA
jgi:hypothetical protein